MLSNVVKALMLVSLLTIIGCGDDDGDKKPKPDGGVTDQKSMEQCDSTSQSDLVYETETLKVTAIQGQIAKDAWDKHPSEETSPKPGSFPEGAVFNPRAKYSENLNCWKYQPRQTVNGKDAGAAKCVHYSCNVIERK